MTISDEKKLEILHDHYKETFTRIKEVEVNRDKLFLWLIAIFAALILQISYPNAISKTIGKLSIFGAELDIKNLPLPTILSVTWMLALVISLRYCQAVIFLNRQYPYLHKLEDKISPELGGDEIYRREGYVYLQDKSPFLNATWVFYDIIFPVIVISATTLLAFLEYAHTFKINVFDSIAAVLMFVIFFIYRILPALIYRWRKLTGRGSP